MTDPIICGVLCTGQHQGRGQLFATLMPERAMLEQHPDPAMLRTGLENAARLAMTGGDGPACEHELRPVPYDPAGSDAQPCSACFIVGWHEAGCAWARVWGSR